MRKTSFVAFPLCGKKRAATIRDWPPFGGFPMEPHFAEKRAMNMNLVETNMADIPDGIKGLWCSIVRSFGKPRSFRKKTALR